MTVHSVNYKGKIVHFSPENPIEADIPTDELHEHLANPSTPRTKRLKARCRWKHASAGEFCEKGVTAGIERMRRGRENLRVADIARGPGRLAAALGVDRRHDGIDLFRRGELWIGDDGCEAGRIGESVRIGLTKGADARLRYYLAGSGYLSGSRRLNI